MYCSPDLLLGFVSGYSPVRANDPVTNKLIRQSHMEMAKLATNIRGCVKYIDAQNRGVLFVQINNETGHFCVCPCPADDCDRSGDGAA